MSSRILFSMSQLAFENKRLGETLFCIEVFMKRKGMGTFSGVIKVKQLPPPSPPT
jgi:hypothetical protein